MEKLPLSVHIITLNESARIARAIRSVVDWAGEVVVVDCGSTDDTVAIARDLGARCVHQDWLGYGAQKRFAEEQCQNDWLLGLDADEYIPEELQKEILQSCHRGDFERFDAFMMRWQHVFPFEKKPKKFAYRSKIIRLYRRSVARYATSPVHDSVIVPKNARVGDLFSPYHHFSVLNINQQIIKSNGYSTMQADDLIARGRKISGIRLFIEYPFSFLKIYFARRFFLYGRWGFILANNQAFMRYLRLAKLFEREQKAKS